MGEYAVDQYGYQTAATPVTVDRASAQERAEFLRRVYQHVAGALAVFIVLEAILQAMPFSVDAAEFMTSGPTWLLVIAGFWVVGMIADRWTSPGLPLSQQYLGLGLFIVAEALIFLPLIAYVRLYEDSNILPTAGILTGALVLGLSLIALDSRTDFSLLRGAIFVVGAVGLGLIVASVLFEVGLGTWFSLLMIGLASASILYKTDQITKSSRADGYVSAALALFASIMLLLWYVIRLLSARR
jgi:FtsH-binding integral membrane protein